MHLREGVAFAGCFSAEQNCQLRNKSLSIQWAELFAVAYSVALYGPWLADSCLIVVTDNMSDVSIINRQSTRSAELLPLLRAIYATCVRYNILLKAQHVAGEDNVVADFMSRPDMHMYAGIGILSRSQCV